MLKLISFLSFCFTIYYSPIYSAQTSFELLQSKCFKCHGKEVDGKIKIKGDFDLTHLLNKKMDQKDANEWIRIVDQIETFSMPPEDSVELDDEETRIILEPIYHFFSSYKNVTTVSEDTMQPLPRRAMTSYEAMYSLSEIFNIDLSTFDPFENFHFIKDTSYKYPTIKSKNLISFDYFKQLEGSVDIVLDHYVSPFISTIYKEEKAMTKLLKQTEYHPKPREPAHSHFVFFNRVTKEELSKEFKAAKELEGEARKKAIAIQKKKLAEAMKERSQQDFSFDIRKRGLIEIPSHAKNLAPGHYQLKLTAETLNRALAQSTKGKIPAGNKYNKKRLEQKEWGALAYEKARLTVMHYGTTYDNRGWYLVPGAKRAEKVLASLEIDDNQKKDYVFEFTLEQPAVISLTWENGPYCSRLNRMNLAGQKASGLKDYNLPCIRIHGNMSMTRKPLTEVKNNYMVKDIKAFSEEKAKIKLTEFIGALSLTQHKKTLLETYDRTKELNLTPYERYLESIKWILMSPEFVYLDANKSFESAARYASYSLLKTNPSESFLKNYRAFREKKLSSQQFAHNLIQDEAFKNFITIFMNHWLDQTVELDEKKFTTTTRSMPFKDESYAYVNNLFRENRPIVELFDSNYRVISPKLSHFYGVAQGELPSKGFSKVSMKEKGQRGGLLSQSAFFIAQSDGVDPLPFKRAKWVVENIFGKSLSEPPNNIDTTIFQETVEAKSFKERTEIHAKHDACYSCHNKIDPFAFAMNNYNTDGTLMLSELDHEAEKNLYAEIQSSQTMIARAFCKNLISFMTGRETQVTDLKTIQDILNSTKSGGYRIRDLYAEILNYYFRVAI